jgi:hypothetical protein
MPRFLIEASYSSEGVAGVADKGGTARREAVEQLIAATRLEQPRTGRATRPLACSN